MKNYSPFIPFNKLPVLKRKNSNIYNLKTFDTNQKYSNLCSSFIKKIYSSKDVLMTNSCTSALEICSYLLNTKKGDEIIFSNYTYVTTANSFVSKGATPVFADIRSDTLNIDEKKIIRLINKKTKAIVINHYGSISSEIGVIQKICKKRKIVLIEDIAESIFSKFKNKYLGSFGDLSTISFHQTKVITCGVGGALLINNKKYLKKARYILDKGTNRCDFDKKSVNKYRWVSYGSSFGLSEIQAKILFYQLKKFKKIIQTRVSAFNFYLKNLSILKNNKIIQLPKVTKFNRINGAIFYLILKSEFERDRLISYLEKFNIFCKTHYEPLNESPFYKKNFSKEIDTNISNRLSRRILRLPIYCKISKISQKRVCKKIKVFFNENK
ncbi:dTDP-4-amino-4,6-dideoxygalactose transaminase [Candidatus Pelagibacter bacterium]|nr:dTDP-4-amino-4,6-dideoxygalactose transaminase [Candidatus Pelagibacter bacterium]